MVYLKIIVIFTIVFTSVFGYGQNDVSIRYAVPLSAEVPLEYTFRKGSENVKKVVKVNLEVKNFEAHHSEIKSYADGGLMGGFKCDIIFNTWFTYSKPEGLYVDGIFITFDELGIQGITFTVKNIRFQWVQGVYGNYKWYSMGSPSLPTNPKGDKPGYTGSVYLQLKEMIGDHGSCAKDVEVVKGKGAIFGYGLEVGEVSFTPPYELRKYLIEKDERDASLNSSSSSSSGGNGITLTSISNNSTSGSNKSSSTPKNSSSTPKSNPTNQPSWLDGLSNEQKIAYHKEAAAQRTLEVEKYRRQQEAKAAEEWRKKRQREVEERERKSQRQFEDLQRSIKARENQGKEQRLAAYIAIGGDANYNAKLNQWRTLATAEVKQINTYLNRYNGNAITFQYPQTSCDYVILIKNIQHTTMPEAYKDVLIDNILTVRNEFYKFDMENGYIDDELDLKFDALGRSNSHLPCSNYLEAIAEYKGFKKYGSFSKKYVYEKGFSTNFTMGSGTTYYEEKYKIPYGALPFRPQSHFKDFVKSKDINIQSVHLDNDYLWSDFHKRPYNWSSGLVHISGELNNNLISRLLWNKPAAIQSEADKHNLLYDIKRGYRLNTIADEIRMTVFNYHTGKHQKAFDHLTRYITLSYGGVQSLADAIKSPDGIKYGLDYDSDKLLEYGFPLLAAALFMEAGHYDQSLLLLNALKIKNIRNKSTYGDSHNAVNEAITKLRNQIYYRNGEYGKMWLPDSDAQIKAESKTINTMFDRIRQFNSRYFSASERKMLQQYSKEHYINFKDYPIQANALIKLGKTKLAKQLFSNAYKYYQKQGVFKGSQTDIDAFKDVLKTFKMSDKKIKFRQSQGYDVFNIILDKYEDDTYIDIFLSTNDIVSYKPYYIEEIYFTKAGRQRSRSVLMYPKSQNENSVITTEYINKTPVDLSTDTQWKDISSKLLNPVLSSKQSMTNLYKQMKRLYAKGPLVANDDAHTFLMSYIQFGVALGEFHDIIPVIAQKALLFPQLAVRVEDRLALLMWSQSFDKYEWEKNPHKRIFANQVKNDAEYKNGVRNYLLIWSEFKISSPIIPFLYNVL